jgi:hypothetical protein
LIKVLDLMLSCRVQGRFVEQAFFSYLSREYSGQGARAIWVNFNSTERNMPALNVLKALHFRPGDTSVAGPGTGMMRELHPPLECDFIKIECPSPINAGYELPNANCISS